MAATPRRSRSPSTRRSAAAAAARRPPQVKDEDFIDKLFVANTHDTLLCFSNRGKVYWLKVYELPQAGRGARGKPIVNLLPLEEGEKHQRGAADQAVRRAALRVHGDQPRHGQEDAADARSRGRAPAASSRVDLRRRATGWSASRSPTAARDHAVSPAAARRSASTRTRCGRWAARPPACAASRWATASELIALIVVGEGHILTASENGYGKLTPLEEFPPHGRGGQGVIALQTSERNGDMVGGAAGAGRATR